MLVNEVFVARLALFFNSLFSFSNYENFIWALSGRCMRTLFLQDEVVEACVNPHELLLDLLVFAF